MNGLEIIPASVNSLEELVYGSTEGGNLGQFLENLLRALYSEKDYNFPTLIPLVGSLIGLVGSASLIVSVWLSVKYHVFNKKENSAGLTGEQVARKILDKNDLQHIKVKVTGSLMFGNSYSHFFKKVRLRRFTRHKTSLTSLGMGAQKASLAILDKEGDPDMPHIFWDSDVAKWIEGFAYSLKNKQNDNRKKPPAFLLQEAVLFV